jgi:hypothetical protein
MSDRWFEQERDEDDAHPCKDCGVATAPCHGPHEHYMVHDKLWCSAGVTEHEILCIGCLEKRLGRELAGEDFSQHAPTNIETHRCTPRMQDRLGRTTPKRRLQRVTRVLDSLGDARDRAIRRLVHTEMAYSEALNLWSKLKNP